MAEIFNLLDYLGGFLFSGALAMVAFTRKEMRVARLLLALCSFFTVARWTVWSFVTESGWLLRGVSGAILGGLLLGAVPALWQWTRQREIAIQPVEARSELSPPVGALRYVLPVMNVGFSHSTNQTAGQMQIELHNDTDSLIYYSATTDGNINGIPFSKEKIEMNGYVSARQSIFLVSNRILGIPIQNTANISEPAIVGIFRYDLKYRYAASTKFSRRSARVVKMVCWQIIRPEKVGEATISRGMNFLSDEIEE